MSDGSRPDFEPPDQWLDGTDRTAGAAEASAVAARSRWPRMAGRPWPRLAAGALAVVAVGGTAWALGGDGAESGPARFTSMPGPCSLVPGPTLERHVPDSGPPVRGKTRTSATERYAACEWTESPLGTESRTGTGPPGEAGGAETFTVQELTISVRLHLEGVTQARSEYDAAWLGARSMAGTSKGAGGSQHAEAPGIVKIGEQAFISYATLSGPLGRSGIATATVRLRNAVITVRFQETTTRFGADASPRAGASKAPDEEAARASAETVAGNVTDTLADCAECLGG